MPLNEYLQQVQRLVGFDENQDLYNPSDLIDFINIARDEVAAQGQCIRRETASAGQVVRIQILNEGQNYTNPTVTISAPDQPSGESPYPNGLQATAVAAAIGGVLSDVGIVHGGDGYFAPSAAVTDPTGTGALLQCHTNIVNTTMPGQEIYRFSDIDLSGVTGVRSVLAVKSVALVWGNWQWTARYCSNSRYMSVIRQFTTNYLAPPEWMTQYGQGVDGSIKLYPIADQMYPMKWDCLCLPSELRFPNDYDAVPDPWRNAVPYYAAHLVMLSKSAQIPQFLGLAQSYFNEKSGGLFGVMMRRARAFAQPGMASSYYGRV